MHYCYPVKGVCASKVDFDIEDGVLRNVEFLGGCEGNHKGLAALMDGMAPEDAAKRMSGITCGRRTTSCPDQLAVVLKDALAK